MTMGNNLSDRLFLAVSQCLRVSGWRVCRGRFTALTWVEIDIQASCWASRWVVTGQGRRPGRWLTLGREKTARVRPERLRRRNRSVCLQRGLRLD